MLSSLHRMWAGGLVGFLVKEVTPAHISQTKVAKLSAKNALEKKPDLVQILIFV